LQVPDKKQILAAHGAIFWLWILIITPSTAVNFFKKFNNFFFLPPSDTIQLNWNSWVVSVTSFLFLFQSFLSCWTYIPTYQRCAVIWMFKEPQGSGHWNTS
jgi:hypothetical protein